MEKMTIKEIAKVCGVGVSTVSRAINNHPDINEETKTKIMEAIRDHHYIPNNSARNLKRSESKTIAVLVKGIDNQFFGPIIKVLEHEIISHRYSFIIQQVEDDEDELEVAVQLEKEKRLKGIIFLGGMYSHTTRSMKRLTVPFVISMVNMELPGGVEGGSVVSIRDEEESRRMTDYLCRCGHKRILLLTAAPDDVSIGRQRQEGYVKALETHGIAFDEDLVVSMKKDLQPYSIENGYETIKELLQKRRDFTCIYAISDTLAIGACRAVFDSGLRVPEDISVAGFDGLDIARYYHPAVTTIVQPRERMAEEAVHLLFDLIKGKEVKHQVIFDAKLAEGESVRKL